MASRNVTDSTAVVAMVRDAQEHPRAATSRLLLDCLDRLTSGAGQGDFVIRRPRGRRPTTRHDGRPVYLSVSHSSDIAAVAVSLHPVGIDIEHIRTVRSVERVGAHITGFMQHGTCAEQSDLHTEVLCAWTRYEAAVKALGVGRALVPSEFHCNAAQKVTFRGMDLPLNLTTGKLYKSGSPDHEGYLVSIAARPTSNVVINHGSDLNYTPVKYERQES